MTLKRLLLLTLIISASILSSAASPGCSCGGKANTSHPGQIPSTQLNF